MSTSMNRSRLGTPGRVSDASFASRFGAVVTAGIERLLDWHERAAQRRNLVGLDDRMLRDIGLTRSDVMREFYKAPWQR